MSSHNNQFEQHMAGNVIPKVEQEAATPLRALETNLTELAENMRQLCIIMENYRDDSEPEWYRQLDIMMKRYRDIKEMPAQSYDVQVPFEVLRLIDGDRNPDQLLRDYLDPIIEDSEKTAVKGTILQSFKDSLLAELGDDFFTVSPAAEVKASSSSSSSSNSAMDHS